MLFHRYSYVEDFTNTDNSILAQGLIIGICCHLYHFFFLILKVVMPSMIYIEVKALFDILQRQISSSQKVEM